MFNYQDIDSNALRALEATTRKNALRKLNASSGYSNMTYDALRNHFRNQSTPSLIILEYNGSDHYKKQESYLDAIADGDIQEQRALDKRASISYAFSTYVLTQPPIDLFPRYADMLSDLIEHSRDESHANVQIEDDLRQIIQIHTEYANSIIDMFETWNFATSDDYGSIMIPLLWRPDEVHNGQTDDTPQESRYDFTELDNSLERLIENLKNPATDAKFVQFLLSPTLGSHDISLMPKTCHPLFVKILPPHISKTRGIEILTAAYEDTEPNSVVFAKREEDKTLQFLESLAQKAIQSSDPDAIRDGQLRWSLGLDQEDRGKGENSPSAFHNAFGEPSGSSKKKGKKPHKGDDPNSSDQKSGGSKDQKRNPPHTTIPDDDDYEPDPMFQRLARDITDHVHSLPSTDLTNDHMIRFTTTSETPHSVSRDFLHDDDQRIVIRNRYGSSMYLITYTRKNRKPIFNPVS
jgi:hypothetical protein